MHEATKSIRSFFRHNASQKRSLRRVLGRDVPHARSSLTVAGSNMGWAPHQCLPSFLKASMPSKDALNVRSATKKRKNDSFHNKLCEMKSVRWNGRQALCATRAEAANYARRVAHGREPVNSVMGRKFANSVKNYIVAAAVCIKLLACFQTQPGKIISVILTKLHVKNVPQKD